MRYKNYLEESNVVFEEMSERLEVVAERLEEISAKQEVEETFAGYFKEVSEYLLMQISIAYAARMDEIKDWTAEQGAAANQRLYGPFQKENYATCYANPTYAVEKMGKEYGGLLAAVFSRIENYASYLFAGNIKFLCTYAELVVELYNMFEVASGQEPEYTPENIKSCIYSFMHDNSEIEMEEAAANMINPAHDYVYTVLMESDISNPAYLYHYGTYVSANDIASSQYLNTFSDEEIQKMADTYTEGYRIGFATGNKDITKKNIVEIRLPLGFERMVRAAVKNFEKMNMKSVIRLMPSSVNKQFDYDIKELTALWMDKAYVEYKLECWHNALEEIKDIAPGYGGPAVIEVFGEEPFSPETKEETPRFDEKQQGYQIHYMGGYINELYSYIHGDERSFTIIAYPVASIGKDYEAIFAETVRINTLDYNLYQTIQQKMIDALDKADRVHITGSGANKTDLYINIWDLQDPAHESAFENCVADVNIPVGEVFTSPVLKGTEGKLHVTQVYLNELNYLNLELDFEDGVIKNYTCTNFEDEAENKKYIENNLMFHHPTLPIGEFAIGTNTTAYRMGRVFDIQDKMPILIAEKTGPHFAVGDTCYNHDEENIVYNPDGKMIVAKENDFSRLRNEDPAKAYFNCHTDITIPYDELEAITVIRKDGTTEDIIRDGRFVLAGTEELNKPLDEI